jgi:teichuronic acid biosynthesis glycosyltransferase TuaG
MPGITSNPSANGPLVSIITPAYRAVKFVGETIASVQAQEHQNWEMLIVDDGSPDETAQVVAQHAAADPRIRLIRQANSGPWAARQTAVDRASGDFVAFLDSDDLWLPGKLSRQLAFMREKNAAISFTRFRRMNADGTHTGHLVEIPAQIDYRGLLRNTVLATSTVMINRSITGSFRLKNTYYDDFALWLDILKRGHVAYGLQEDLMRYRVMNASVSRNKRKSAYMVWRTFREVESLNPVYATWCFFGYAFNAWKKYRRF